MGSAALVRYAIDRGVAVLTLDRPGKANVQNYALLDELDAGWTRAVADDEARVILVRAEGRHFSAGHDIGPERGDAASRALRADGEWTVVHQYRSELQRYLGYSMRWRDAPKPSVAAVQGKCMGGGLLLCWPCDLIVAAEDAEFSDPVVKVGFPYSEYLAHPWELGLRRAKELLFTGRSIDAATAQLIGMVSRVVPRVDLDAAAMDLAFEIAERDPFAVMMAKRFLNQTQDAMGFTTSVRSAFDGHHVVHGATWSSDGVREVNGFDRLPPKR